MYEVDVSDTGPVSEDEDILNYDDVDDPDALCIKHFWTKCPEVVTCRLYGRLFSWPGKPPEKWRLYAVLFFRY